MLLYLKPFITKLLQHRFVPFISMFLPLSLEPTLIRPHPPQSTEPNLYQDYGRILRGQIQWSSLRLLIWKSLSNSSSLNDKCQILFAMPSLWNVFQSLCSAPRKVALFYRNCLRAAVTLSPLLESPCWDLSQGHHKSWINTSQMNEHRHNEDRLRSEVGMGWWTVWFLLFMVVTFYKAAMNMEWMNCEQLPLGGNQGSSSCSLCSQHFHQWSIPNSVLCVFLSKDTLLDIYCWFLKFMMEWSSSNTPFGSSPPSCMQETREPFGALLGSHFKQQNHQCEGQKFEKPGSKWTVKGTLVHRMRSLSWESGSDDRYFITLPVREWSG